MGLYKNIDNIENKLKIKKYEKTINDIKNVSYIYEGLLSECPNLDVRVRYCLDNGINGLKYYISSYMNTDFYKDDFTFEESLEKFSLIQRKLEKTVLNKINYIIDIVSKDISKDKLKELNNYFNSSALKNNKLKVGLSYLNKLYESYPEKFNNNIDIDTAFFDILSYVDVNIQKTSNIISNNLSQKVTLKGRILRNFNSMFPSVIESICDNYSFEDIKNNMDKIYLAVTEEDKLSVINSYLQKIYLNDKTIFENNSNIQAKLLLALSSIDNKYVKILEPYKNEIVNKNDKGLSSILIIEKIISDKKINLNIDEMIGDIDKYVNLYGIKDFTLNDEKRNYLKNVKFDIKNALLNINAHIDVHFDKENDLFDKLNDKLGDALIKNAFISETNKLRNVVIGLIENGISKEEALKKVENDAYALVKTAIKYIKDIDIHDVQLMGALALNDSSIAEMYTGEGKTFTAIFPAYLNALTGQEVDIFTPNDYLAQRDSNDNKKIFELLGLHVGCTLISGQSDEEKKQVYKCDVVYGSSTAFAFDYLHDTMVKDKNDFYQKSKRPYMALVDEADQILINNALQPFIMEQNNKRLSYEDKKNNEEILFMLNNASLFVDKYLKDDFMEFDNLDEYQKMTGQNIYGVSKEHNDASLYIYREKVTGKNQFYISEKGLNKLFSYAMRNEINDLVEQSRTYFEGNDAYIENEHYEINNGKFSLTDKGLRKACLNTDEFYQLKMKFYTDEKYNVLRRYVSNAITSEFLMEKGRDYKVGLDENNNQIIEVLQDGRVVPSSKFSNGLQETLALKENISIVPKKNEKLLEDTSHSLSVRSLLSLYEKRCGMTGTADKIAFDELYGLDTVEIPKNKEYIYMKDPKHHVKPSKRKDLPEKLYRTKSEKEQGIIEEIIKSKVNDQPVLVVTDNIEDAQNFYDKLVDAGLNANLLIADRNLKEENEIISEAGGLGAITIATEMAGRGTDIKLGGGDKEKRKIRYQIFTNEAIQKLVSIKLTDYSFMPLESKKSFIETEKSRLLSENKELQDKVVELARKYTKDENYKRLIDDQVDRTYDENIRVIKNAGGLKYIQMNPFITERNDNQGKGRVGRQGEPGITQVFSCLEDLSHLGVPYEDIKMLSELIDDNSYIDDDKTDGLLKQIIENAQSENEIQMDYKIAGTDSIDLIISARQRMIFNTKKQLTENDNLDIAVNNLIFSAIEDILEDSVNKKKRKKLSRDKTRLTRLKIESDKLVNNFENIFGVKIDINDIYSECTDVWDIKNYLFNIVSNKKEDIAKETNIKYKNILNKYLDNILVDFSNGVEDIQLQILNDEIAKNENARMNRYKDVDNLYFESRKKNMYVAMRTIFNVKEKQEEIFETNSLDEHLNEIFEQNQKSRVKILNQEEKNSIKIK